MALTIGSQILVSDISNALAGKQDTLGYVPVKSVNGTQADETGAVTIDSGSSPTYAYCTVKGTSNRAYTKVIEYNVAYGNNSYINHDDGEGSTSTEHFARINVPSGGTWACIQADNVKNNKIPALISGGSGVEIKFFEEYGSSNKQSYTSSVCFVKLA